MYLVKKNNALYPAHDSDHRELSKYKIGDILDCKLTKPRNPEFHKKFFALLNLGFSNQDKYSKFEHYRIVMTMKAGFYEQIKTDRGTIYTAKSISFGSMPQDEFERVFDAVLMFICADIGVEKETVMNELINFM